MCEPHYVNFFFFFLWTSSIVYLFDFLTFDIFLTIWHLFDNLTSFWHFDISFNLNHLSPSQGYFWHLTSFLTIWHPFDNLTSFWHMSNVAHGQWGTWAMGHMFLTFWHLFKVKPPQLITGLFLAEMLEAKGFMTSLHWQTVSHTHCLECYTLCQELGIINRSWLAGVC